MPKVPHLPAKGDVPGELTKLPQWVCWAARMRKARSAKVPINLATGKLASVSNPATWGTFDAALAAAEKRRLPGIGFVFTESDPYVGIDLDHCRDPATGKIDPWAEKIIKQIDSYTEISPSGTGVHVLLKGSLPAGSAHRTSGGNDGGSVEIYAQGRYFTVTGQRIPNTSMTINNRSGQLVALCQEFFGAMGTVADSAPKQAGAGTADSALIQKALAAKNGKKFRLLWEGHWKKAGYQSKSEASLALCRLLSFWAGKDAAAIDGLFRGSGLYTAKWERPDYRTATIGKAVAATREVYHSGASITREHSGGGEGEPSAYVTTDGGVWHRNKEGELTWLSSRLDVTGVTRDGSGNDWGRLVRFPDLDGVGHTVSIPMAWKPEQVRQFLAAEGLRISPWPTTVNRLAAYLIEATPKRRVRAAAQIGWVGNVFVLPEMTIGGSEEDVVFQPAFPVDHGYGIRGSLTEWRHEVAKRCQNNSRLMFALSVALAPVLLRWSEVAGGGFHLKGPSSIGKTTGLRVAASVWGPPGFLRSWRTTGNALEGVAATRNDSLLCLDELGQLDGREAANAVYLLANGLAKSRMARAGGLRPLERWRALVLSSGEVSLGDLIAEVGRRSRGGVAVRLIDLPADAGAGAGLFEATHAAESARAFADELAAATAQYYGSAGPAFVECIQNNFKDGDLSALIPAECAEFIKKHVPVGAGPEVQREASLFALVAFAGRLAVEAGILPGRADETEAAVVACFKASLESRHGTGQHDAEAAIEQVRSILQRDGASRFQLRKKGAIPVRDRLGFRDGNDYLVFPEQFQQVLCAGYDAQQIARELVKRGFLRKDRKRLQTQCRLLGVGQTRVYWILTSILEGSEDEQAITWR